MATKPIEDHTTSTASTSSVASAKKRYQKQFVVRPQTGWVLEAPEPNLPLPRPPEGASAEEWAAYRKERKRRQILKALRRGRIERRSNPHNHKTCDICAAHMPTSRYENIELSELAKRTGVSKSHLHRIFSSNPNTARGRRSLSTHRRIAHAMGITLDEYANIVLD